MKIFVVNLKRSVERRALIEGQLRKLGLDYEIFEAVDGSALTDDEIAGLCDSKAIKPYSRYLTKGLIGASLSHYRVCERIVKDQLDKALVLEDDVWLSGELPVLLEMLNGEVSGDEIVLLCFAAFQPIIFSNVKKKHLHSKFQLAQPVDLSILGSACGYVVTQEVARKMVSMNFPLKIIGDCWGDFWKMGCLENIRCVVPMAVQPAWHLKSDMGYLDNRKLAGSIKSLAYRYNISFINQILGWKRSMSWKKRTRYSFSDELPQKQERDVPASLI